MGKHSVYVHSLIDTILKHLIQFNCDWNDNDDCGTYYDNFVDGRGF